MEIESLRSYLTWLVTPQNERERKAFEDNNLIESSLKIVSKVPTMSFQELVLEINHQLEPYNKELDILAPEISFYLK